LPFRLHFDDPTFGWMRESGSIKGHVSSNINFLE
jgi:hypothetical protein